MITFLVAVTMVLQPIMGCNILGFKYIPPADTRSSASASTASVNTRQSCVQCSRSDDDDSSVFSRAFSGKPSGRMFWGASPSVTTAATTSGTTSTTTTAPCCTTAELRNTTGTGTPRRLNNQSFTGIFISVRLWSCQHQNSGRAGRHGESVPLDLRYPEQ